MKSNRGNLLWGVFLILIGGFFLAVNMEWIPELSEFLWSVVFGLIGLIFLFGYFNSSIRNWGLLVPAAASIAIAITIWLSRREVDGTIIGGLFMVMISLPFWVGYLVDRKRNWGALIPGWITAVIGVIILLAGRGADELIGALIMFAIGLPFFVVYFSNRKNWWALIPGWVMSVLGVIILLSNQVSGELIGALFMFAIGIPFYVVYFMNRKYRWALIPAWVVTVLGFIILLSQAVAGEWIGTIMMFAIAIPFFLLYTRGREYWWALIPAGALTSVGAIILLSTLDLSEAVQVRLLGSVIFVGLSATFTALWLRRSTLETDWAKYPAAGLGIAALLVILFGAEMEIVWSILLIGAGIWLLYNRAPRPKEKL